MFSFLTFKGISSRVTFDHVMLPRRFVVFIIRVVDMRLVACFGCSVASVSR